MNKFGDDKAEDLIQLGNSRVKMKLPKIQLVEIGLARHNID